MENDDQKFQETCPNCGYSWMCKSKMLVVACPSCRHTVKAKHVTITPAESVNPVYSS